MSRFRHVELVADRDARGNKDIGCQPAFIANHNRRGVNGEMLTCMVVATGA